MCTLICSYKSPCRSAKVCSDSAEQAERHPRVRFGKNTPDRRPLHAYQCDDCGRYCLGNKPTD